jgi:hypothetical protein
MPLPALDNLVRTGTLKAEPADQREFDNLVRSGRKRLDDARQTQLSPESRFDLAYNAAHALSLAAMRWHGYRPDRQRFVVFQSLVHTLNLPPEMVRILDKCHGKRNLVEYEGESEIDIRLLEELIRVTSFVAEAVERLGPVAPKS